MRRISLAVAAASLVAGGVLPTTAAATEVQLGQTSTAIVAPVCPAGTTAATCDILLTQMTGLETVSNGTAYPTRVTHSGVLTTLNLGVSAAAKKYVATLDKPTAQKGYGGPPQAEVTVLRPVGAPGRFRWEVAAQSAAVQLISYMGDVVQFPLGTEIPVVPGEVVALSTATWAPVLSIDLTPASQFAYRQPVVPQAATAGAKLACTQTTLATPLVIGNQSTYGCNYTGTRIEYTVTEVITPSPTAAIRMARRTGHVTRRPRIVARAR